MNEQLEWTLESTCSGCSHESTSSLHMGVVARCRKCGEAIQIDPLKTVFHRSSGAGYWTGAKR